MSFGHSFVSDIPVAFWRNCLPIRRLRSNSDGCCIGSHISLNGSKQIFLNRQTSQVQTLLHQKENHDNDFGYVVVRHVFFITLPAQRRQNGVSSFQEFLLSSYR